MPIATEKRERLPLDKIEIDPDVQPREKCNPAIIEEYTEAMREGAKFPDIVVFASDGHFLLADGHYRLEAMRRLDKIPETVNCRVFKGDKRAAMLWAAGANADHGARRTNADKRRSVSRLLNDKRWSRWTDRRIARHCGVSNNFVSALRKQLSSDDSCHEVKHEGLDGKLRKRPAKERKPEQLGEDAKAGGTTETCEIPPAGNGRKPSTGGESADLENGEGGRKRRTKTQLLKELQAVIMPLLEHWSRPEMARVLRDIADNFDPAR